MPISLCMIAKNEGQTIRKALLSALPFVDEVCVSIDASTSDNTGVEVLKTLEHYGGKTQVTKHVWKGDFSKARNDLIDKASYDFIFTLDGHETVRGVEKLLQIRDDLQGFEVFFVNVRMIADGMETMFEQERLFHRNYRYHNKSHNVLIYPPEKAAKISGVTIDHERSKALSDARLKQRSEMNIKDLRERALDGDRRARAQLTQEYMAQRNWTQAIREMSLYLMEDMADRERYQVYIKMAMCFYFSRRYLECENALMQCAWINEDNRNAHLVFAAELFMKTKNFALAESLANAALDVKMPDRFYFLYPKFYYEIPLKLLEKINDHNNLKSVGKAQDQPVKQFQHAIQ